MKSVFNGVVSAALSHDEGHWHKRHLLLWFNIAIWELISPAQLIPLFIDMYLYARWKKKKI